MSDLTGGLPGWLGVVFVVVFVAAGWFGVWQLQSWAGRRALRGRALREQRQRAKAQRPRYAHSVERLVGDRDAFALAASAWLAQTNGQSIDVFAYDNPEQLRDDVLPRQYQVHDRESLMTKIVTLLIEGHRLHPHGDAKGSIDFVAWDLIRVIELSRAAVGLRAVDEEIGRDMARFAARALQSRYPGWALLAEPLERAFMHSHEKTTKHERRLGDIAGEGYRRMLAASDGPWARVGWGTHVKRSELALLDEAPRRDVARAPQEQWERQLFAKLSAGAETGE